MKAFADQQSRQLLIILVVVVILVLAWHPPLLALDANEAATSKELTEAKEAPAPQEEAIAVRKRRSRKKQLANIVLGLGYVYSSDYYHTLKDAYPGHTISGGYGWADLQLGVRFNLTEQLSLTPGMDLLINFGTGDVSFTNTIFVPSLSGRFALWQEPALYLRGEVNYGILNIGADFDADSKGIGYAAAIGYSFARVVDLEIGYLYLPVEIKRGLATDKENFGGIFLKCSVAI